MKDIGSDLLGTSETTISALNKLFGASKFSFMLTQAALSRFLGQKTSDWTK